MHDWEYASSEIDWTKGREVGRGAFGVVHDVPCMGLHIAAKRMDVTIGRQRAELERLLLREFRALHKVMHANVVRVLGVVVDDPSYVCLLTELATRGSLRLLLDSTPDGVVQQPTVQISLTNDMAIGMAYLHSLEPPIIHHDIKPENVLSLSRSNVWYHAAPWCSACRPQLSADSIRVHAFRYCSLAAAQVITSARLATLV